MSNDSKKQLSGTPRSFSELQETRAKRHAKLREEISESERERWANDREEREQEREEREERDFEYSRARSRGGRAGLRNGDYRRPPWSEGYRTRDGRARSRRAGRDFHDSRAASTSLPDHLVLSDETHPKKFSVLMALISQPHRFPIESHLAANELSCYKYEIGREYGSYFRRIPSDEPRLVEIHDEFAALIEKEIQEQVEDVNFVYGRHGFGFAVKDDVAIASFGLNYVTTCLRLDLDIDSFNDRIEALMSPEPIEVCKWTMQPYLPGSMSLSPTFVDISNAQIWAEDCFYPGLDKSVSEKITDFLTSDNNMWILYGSAGTGKSTLARQVWKIMSGSYSNAHVINAADAINDPSFTDNFIHFHGNEILFIEDAGALMSEQGVSSHFMTAILNLFNDPERSTLKVIFLCNSPTLSDVDEVLLNYARLFETTHFGKLTKEQTLAIEDRVSGVKRTGDGLVLAELFEKPLVSTGVAFTGE